MADQTTDKPAETIIEAPVTPAAAEATTAVADAQLKSQPSKINALHNSKQPFWLSGGWTGFIAMLITTNIAMLVKAHDVAMILAGGCAAGLPALIVAGKAVDWQRTKQIGESKP